MTDPMIPASKLIEGLLPCPFCGSSAVLLKTGHAYYVQCTECLTQTAHFRKNGKEDAMKFWNRRASTEAQAEAREGEKPPHPQIIRFETTMDGEYVTVRRDALEWLENQITLAPPASAGAEGPDAGTLEIVIANALPLNWRDLKLSEVAEIAAVAALARPVEGEKK